VQLPAGVDEGLGEHRETRRRADDGDRAHTCILQAYDRMARAYNALVAFPSPPQLEITNCDFKFPRRVRRCRPRHAFSIAGERAGA
jgi:hypothetical protein